MADKFGIKVLCSKCGHVDMLTSEEDKETPLLFDDSASAQSYLVPLKLEGTFTAGMSGDNDKPSDKHECTQCHTISHLRDLNTTVFRHTGESVG